MFFKSAAPFARTAAAAKTIWISGSGQTVPGFFVSTPQFQRQRSQVGHVGESHRYSSSLDSGYYLAFPGSGNCGPTPTAASLDDEKDDDLDKRLASASVRAVPADKVHFVAAELDNIDGPGVGLDGVSEGPEEASISQLEDSKDATSIEQTLVELQGQGAHDQVVRTFTELEHYTADISIGTYNLLLQSLAHLALQSRDVSALLQSYERLLELEVTPSRETYGIVIDALASLAEKNFVQRQKLELLVGTPRDELDPSSEVLGTLPVSDYLELAMGIFTASVCVDKTNYAQAPLDRLVIACSNTGVDCTDLLTFASDNALAAKLRSQDTIEDVLSCYNGSRTADQAAKHAVVDAAFKFCGPSEAVVLYEKLFDETDQKTLLSTVARNFAERGLAATALRWIRNSPSKLSVNEVSQVLQAICESGSEDALPTAALLYESLAVTKDSASSTQFAIARSAFAKLCSITQNVQPLLSVIQESQLRGAIWSPDTVTAVFNRLVAQDKLALAIDVFNDQCQMLSAEWATEGVECFVGQEMFSSIMSTLQRAVADPENGVFVAVQLVRNPLLVNSLQARNLALDCLWKARMSFDPKLQTEIAASNDVLLAILEIHLRWILDSEAHESVTIPPSELANLRQIFPLFVSDVIQNKLRVPTRVAHNIERCLNLLGVGAQPWIDYQRSSTGGAEHQTFTSASREVNAQLIRYCNTANGLETAYDIAESSFLRRELPSTQALVTLVKTALRSKVKAQVTRVFDLLRASLPSAQDSLVGGNMWIDLCRIFVEGITANKEVALASYDLLTAAGSAPTADGYAALIKANSQNASEVTSLLNEAQSKGIIPNAELYNVALNSLVKLRRFDEARAVFSEMDRLSLTKSSKTLRDMIIVACETDDWDSAFKLFSELDPSSDDVVKTSSLNSLMQYLIHTKHNRNDAINLFTETQSREGVLSPSSYKLLIDAWLQPPMNLRNADRVLAMLKEHGVPFTTQHFAALLRARGVLAKDLDAARDFYRGLVKNSRVLPDKHIFRALLESYVANGEAAETPKVLDEMAKYHVAVDSTMMDTLVSGLKGTDPARARQLSAMH